MGRLEPCGARIAADRQGHTQTLTKYRNPRCAWLKGTEVQTLGAKRARCSADVSYTYGLVSQFLVLTQASQLHQWVAVS